MGRSEKILPIEELPARLKSLGTGKKRVHCHGVFDLLHIGHIRHLKQAREMGDVLVVTVTPDHHVNKGPHRPIFPEMLRAEAIAALDCVDLVAINKWPTAVEAIKIVKPHFYVKGPDYGEPQKDLTGGIGLEEEAVRSVGGSLTVTEDVTFSSSNLINKHLEVFPREVGEFLTDFSRRHSTATIHALLDEIRSLKVLVVGEAIIDEYQYCETLGKSGKEPILASRFVSSERFAGGVLAVANQVSSLCDHVALLTSLGSAETHEEFIRRSLHPGIDCRFIYQDQASTIVKRRFVELYPFQKLFEIYVMDGSEGNAARSKALCEGLEEMLPRFDLAIVADYGHGLIEPAAVDVLCRMARFLTVNTQMNADNRGFNTVSKYRKADYVCVSEQEIRLEARSRMRDLRDIVRETADRLSCGRILITRGKQGCMAYDAKLGFFEVPALTSRVVDRIGAGDAVLSVTAMCAARGAPMEVVAFIGNAVGAQAVATVGHRRTVERVPLLKHMESLLK